ncbi:MAG TPA: type VI secretion system lipoprotein TssJ, partial [Dongiaceae bacterium]|nr:type VI secretion system lipoprotein TssJ [Dongiaceae bacterium]
RVYQLGAVGGFEKADFFQLYEKENAALGTDLIGRDQMVLEPGETKTLKFELKPMAKFVGIMAAFRNIDQSEWRADAEIPPNKTTKLTVTVDKLSVKLAPAGS